MKIAILGHFAEKQNAFDGQTIKTRNFYNLIVDNVDVVEKIDTFNWKKHPFVLIKNIYSALKNNDKLFMLPAQKGLKVFAPLIVKINNKYHKDIYYNVVGGWLYKFIKSAPKMVSCLNKFNAILVETNTMKDELSTLFNQKVFVLKNYKNLQIVNRNNLEIYNCSIKKFCIFSRIIEEKGITDAIVAIAQINNGGQKVFLDLYGAISEEYRKKFEKLINENRSCVRYCGIINSNSSGYILSSYYALLFPTRFATEGIPGTIIDCFYAGTPVIAAKWNSFYDILDDKICLNYVLGDCNALVLAIIQSLKMNFDTYKIMSNSMYVKSEEYGKEAIYRNLNEICFLTSN